MNKPIRIQRKRTKGFNLQAQSPDGRPVVSVCRPGKWGNPYIVRTEYWFPNNIYTVDIEGAKEYSFDTKHDATQFAKDMYREYVIYMHEASGNFLDDIKTELVGKHLACFCPLDSPCHADVLLEIANS